MRWLIRIVIVLLVLAGAAYGVSHQLRPVAVYQPVKRGMVPDAVAGTINVFAEVLEVQAEVEGRILKSNLELGRDVRAGDVLVEIDSSALRIQIDRLESDLIAARRRLEIGSPREQDLAAAKEALRLAEVDFERGSIASLSLEASRRSAKSAEQVAELERVRLAQDVATLENELKLSRNRLERMTITAGVDGRVVESRVIVSERVSPGTVVARIESRERLVELRVSEDDVAKLRPGLKARLQFQPYPLQRFDGTIEQILPPLEANTQRYRVFLEVAIEPERLLHGMTGEGYVTIEEHPDALILPRAALFDRQVYVIRDGRAVLQPVELGFGGIHEVEVTKGLEEGDWVVVEGLDALRDGDRVRPQKKS